jgi:Cu(I)/Ag(I) efflux system membrane fusion protein
MKYTLNTSALFFSILFFLLACGNQQQQAREVPGKEVELAGDEADETPVDPSEVLAYDPGDTVVNVNAAEINARLREHTSVVVNTYLELGEALMQDDTEAARSRAEQIREILERNEQENMELQPQTKELYTNAAHIIRQSARNLLAADNTPPIKTAYAAMAPAAYKLAKISDFNGHDLYYQFCPEALEGEGAYWLSRSEDSANPYGEASELQNCGQIVGKL